MAQLQDYTLQIQELVHDLAGVDYTQAELTSYVNSARERCALDMACVRRLVQGATFIPGQEQYPILGGVMGGAVTLGGSGYNPAVPPVVTIGPPAAGGVQATAVAVVASSGTAVTQIQMTNWGSNYTAIPAMTIAPPGVGVTATATALALPKAFDINSIAPLNGNLRYTMSWLPFSPFQAFCRAYTQQFRQPAVWSTIDEANILFVFPIPDQSYPADFDMVTLPDPLVNPTDVDLQVLPPWNDCVQYYGAYKALLKLQNFGQADYYKKAYDDRVAKLLLTRQGRRVISIYRNWFRRMARL